VFGSEAIMRFDSTGESGEPERNEERRVPRFRTVKGRIRQTVEEVSETFRDTFGALRLSADISRKADRVRWAVTPADQAEDFEEPYTGGYEAELVVEDSHDQDRHGEGEEGEAEEEEEDGSTQGSGDHSMSSAGSVEVRASQPRASKLRRRRSSNE
jgi:hypothetical protein